MTKTPGTSLKATSPAAAAVEPQWRLVPSDDGSGAISLPGGADGICTVTGNVGARLIRRLPPQESGAVSLLGADVFVSSGQVLIGVVRDTTAAAPVIRLAAENRWQHAAVALNGPADHLVVYLADEATTASVRSVSFGAMTHVEASTSPATASVVSQFDDVTPLLDHSDRPPAVRLTSVDPVSIGQPMTIEGTLYPGIEWYSRKDPETHVTEWFSEDAVTFQGPVTASIDTGEPVNVTGGAAFHATFRLVRNEMHTLTASVGTTDGRTVSGRTMLVGPRSLTPRGPSSVGLGTGGSTVPVTVNALPEGFFRDLTVHPDHGNPTTVPFSGGTWSGTVTLSALPLGDRSIAVIASSAFGPSENATITLVGRDVTPPTVRLPPSAVAGDDGQIRIKATATDAQSGMVGGRANVAITLLPSGPIALVTPETAGDWRTLAVEFAPVSTGPTSLAVTATDAAGCSATVNHEFDIMTDQIPSSLEDRLSMVRYLRAVMSFARDFVSSTAAPLSPVSAIELSAALSQPLNQLSEPSSPATHAALGGINELRVPVELLRAHIAAGHLDTSPGAAGEQAYALAAYEAVLIAAGTNYEELRLARTASDADRLALATRIGLPLYGLGDDGARPDQLDSITRTPEELTEALLEELFGLPSTDVNLSPLREVPPSRLSSWRMEALRGGWHQQDKRPIVATAYTALVDPDLITEADVVPGCPSASAVTTLLTNRRADLARQSAATEAAIAAAPDTQAKLAAAVASAIPTAGATFLTDLITADRAGTDINAQLIEVGLDRIGFAFLAQLNDLASGGSVTAPEWIDVTQLLTGAYRRRQYATWVSQEDTIVLAPDTFQDGGSAPTLSTLRIDSRARTDWIATLVGRTRQERDEADAWADVVRAAERAAMPMLRDALLSDVPASPERDAGERMTDRYGLDFKASGTVETTRLAQAVAALQTLLALIRSGDVSDDSPANAWVLQPAAAGKPTFDDAWTVMGEYDSWREAVTAFLFPEEHLDPALLDPSIYPPALQSASFASLCAKVRASIDLSPGDAQRLLTEYFQAVSTQHPAPTKWLSNRDPAWQQTLLSMSERALKKDPDESWVREIFWAAPMLIAERLQASGHFQFALDVLWVIYPYNDATSPSASAIIDNELKLQPARPSMQFDKTWTGRRNPFALISSRPAPYLRATLLAIVDCLIDFADAQFTSEGEDELGHARVLYLTAARLLDHPRLAAVPVADDSPGEAAFPLPTVSVFKARVTNQLTKLRQGRNIAGLPRHGVSLGFASGTIRQPTPYHYKTLLGRAQELARQATQLEATYLSLLEKYDLKTLQLHDAIAALGVTTMQRQVSADQITAAIDAKAVADAQVVKAATTVTVYKDAIAAPTNKYEQKLLEQYGEQRDLQDLLVSATTAVNIARAAVNAANGFLFSFGASGALAGAQAVAEIGAGLAQYKVNNLQAQMQANQLQGNVEQRIDEWRRQQAIALQDLAVCNKQQRVSEDQIHIAITQSAITDQQAENARATVSVLQSQFTNPDLYKLMSDVISAAYRWMLQQATSLARLAQEQLAFERAESTRNFIQRDYWQTPGALVHAGRDTSRGMTGAERLTTDLAQLDAYAFSSESRLLNLTQTFSLAQLMPVDFMGFRASGRLTFSSPIDWVQQAFPGLYRCLIHQVQVNVVALVPPTLGIRATLRNNGVSRVTTKTDQGAFVDMILCRDPSTVALTSPIAATGTFARDVQPDLMLPFEGIGVDTIWDFDMPIAANPIDYTTISDVLITIDYTAISDPDYAATIIRSLNGNPTRGGDLAFSLSRDFPDAWYAFQNASGSPHQVSATVTVRSSGLPHGVTNVRTANIAMHIVSRTELKPVNATLGRPIGDAIVGGAAQLGPDGTASTRRGAAEWRALIGADPAGAWIITFDAMFLEQAVAGPFEDVVLVISWTGQSPAWNV